MSTADIGGVCLSYDVAGDGEPVLLVCGTGQPAFTWSMFQVPALVAAGYAVVTFDNRGVAPSDSPPPPYSVDQLVADAAGLIEHLGLERVRVAGLSLGAMITQELALARPDLLRCAVMMGTFGRQDAFRRAVIESWVELDNSGVELPRLYEVVTSAYSLFAPATLSDETRVRQFIDIALAMPPWEGPGRLGQHLADLAYDDRLEALSGVTVPSTVIAFGHDVLTPPALCREVADAIPGCRYVEIPGTGHFGPAESPDAVNAALLEAFAKA
jgi:pimeloyl-ACP methyl ester carboxylesterase